jgi:HEAT repeat protein
MIDLMALLVTLGLLLAILTLTTIAAVGNKIYTNREAGSKKRFLDRLRKRFLKLRTIEGQREVMPGIVASMSGRWSELAAEEISQLELPLRLDVLHALEAGGVVTRITKQAKSPFKWTRAHALRILGELKLPQSVPTMLQALEDRDADVRNVAARSLGRMKLQAAEDALVGLLGKHDQAVSARIAAMCIEMGPRTAPLLIKTLREGTTKARFWAARILGEIADPRSTRSICDSLQDPDPEVRSAAAWAAGNIGDRACAPFVAPLLHDTVWFVRAQASNALGKINDPAYAAPLADALRDSSWWVRRNAQDALVKLGAPAKPALYAAMEGEDRFARDSAVDALMALGVTAIVPRREGAQP